jgi:ferredoxin
MNQGERMKITVDQDKCIAAGMCVMEAPELFDQRDEDGVVVLLNDSPTQDQIPSARRATALCPAAIIFLDETDA